MEYSDQTYPECDFLKELKSVSENDTIAFFDEVESDLCSLDVRVRERAFFIKGLVSFMKNQYDDAFYYYSETIKCNPNKALYWGYASNALYRKFAAEEEFDLLHDAYLCGKLSRTAIDLDLSNPRWHFYHSLHLNALAYSHPHYIIQSVIEITRAQDLCREDQLGLYQAILSQKQNLIKLFLYFEHKEVSIPRANILIESMSV